MGFSINNFTVKYCGKKKKLMNMMPCKLPITVQEKKQRVSVLYSLRLFCGKLNKVNKLMTF